MTISRFGSKEETMYGSRTIGRSRGAGSGGFASLSEQDRQYLADSIRKAREHAADDELSGEHRVVEMLEHFGLGSERVERLREAIQKIDIREGIERAVDYLSEQIENARDYSRQHPGKVIGGAAGVLVGASLLAMAISRATGEGGGERRLRSASSKAKARKASRGSGSTKSSTAAKKKTSAKSAGAAPKRSASPASRTVGRKVAGSKTTAARRSGAKPTGSSKTGSSKAGSISTKPGSKSSDRGTRPAARRAPRKSSSRR